MFTMMANNQDILAHYSNKACEGDVQVEDTYFMGFKKMRKTIWNGDLDLKKFKNHLNMHGSVDVEGQDTVESSGDEESEEGEVEM